MTDRAGLADLAVDEARKAGATYAEARAERGGSESYLLKNGNPEISDRSVYDGISVRVLARGALGFASTNDLSPRSVREIARRAVKLAVAGSKRRKNPIEFSSEKAEVANVVLKPKRAFADVPPEERIEFRDDRLYLARGFIGLAFKSMIRDHARNCHHKPEDGADERFPNTAGQILGLDRSAQ